MEDYFGNEVESDKRMLSLSRRMGSQAKMSTKGRMV